MKRSDWFCTEIILIRHAESFNNCTYELVRQRFGDNISDKDFEMELNKLHDPDCGISPKGENQVNFLKDFLQKDGMKQILPSFQSDEWELYSSPMKRCLLTSQQVSIGLGNKPVIVKPNLFESDGCYHTNDDGSTKGLPGMSKIEVENKFPNFTCLEGMENGWYKLPAKETKDQFLTRSKQVAQELWSLHHARQEKNDSGSGGLIIVAHGNLISSILCELLQSHSLYACCNTGLTQLQLWSSKVDHKRLVTVGFFNRVDHLTTQPHLIGGNELFDDHWIQEYFSEHFEEDI